MKRETEGPTFKLQSIILSEDISRHGRFYCYQLHYENIVYVLTAEPVAITTPHRLNGKNINNEGRARPQQQPAGGHTLNHRPMMAITNYKARTLSKPPEA